MTETEYREELAEKQDQIDRLLVERKTLQAEIARRRAASDRLALRTIASERQRDCLRGVLDSILDVQAARRG